MSHGKMIEAQRTAAESKAKLHEMDAEGKKLDTDLVEMKLKLGGFTRNREAVRGKLRLAKNTLSERERELLRVQNELRQAAKSGDTSTDYKFVVDTAADKLKESKEDVRVLRAQREASTRRLTAQALTSQTWKRNARRLSKRRKICRRCMART